MSRLRNDLQSHRSTDWQRPDHHLKEVRKHLEFTGTTAKEAMSTLSGSFSTAKAAFTNFLDDSGGVKQLVDAVSNAMNIVVDRLKELLPRLTTGLTAVIRGLMPKVPGIIEDLLPAIVEGASILINGFISIAPKLIDTMLGIFPGAIKTLASGLEEALPVLSPLTSAISFLADNFDKVLLVVVPLAAGIVAYNAVVGIAAAIQKSSTIATIADTAAKVAAALATGGLTAAVASLNATMSINPVGVMVAGIAALTAGIIGVVKWINRDTEEQKELKNSTEALADANNELLGSIEESNKTYEDTAKSIISNESASKKLTDKIYELSAAESKSAKEKERLALYVEQLNGLMPELNLQYNKEADALNLTQEATLRLIEAKKDESKQGLCVAKSYFRRYMKIYNMINSRELQEDAHLESRHSFTRKRKMCLKDIVLCALCKKGLTMAMELRQYFRQKCCGIMNISKQGYLQQRKKAEPRGIFLSEQRISWGIVKKNAHPSRRQKVSNGSVGTG